MRLKKGMRKALSLALSTALIITSANIGSIKSKAAEATTTKTTAKSEAVLSYTATDIELKSDNTVSIGSKEGKLVSAIRGGYVGDKNEYAGRVYVDIPVKSGIDGSIKSVVEKMEKPTIGVEIERDAGSNDSNISAMCTALNYWDNLTYWTSATIDYKSGWEAWDNATIILYAGKEVEIIRLKNLVLNYMMQQQVLM